MTCKPINAVVAITLTLLSLDLYAADTFKGARTYDRHCQFCHGQSGVSHMAHIPGLTEGARLRRSDLSLKSRIEEGKRGCPSFRGVIPERDLLDLIAFLRTLN